MRNTVKIVSKTGAVGECLPPALATWEALGWRKADENPAPKQKKREAPADEAAAD